MQLRHLRTFVAVAATLSFTRAAAMVHLAQSSVTEQIQALEADLGAALFERSRHGLRITQAGRSLLPYAERLLALAHEARAAVAATTGQIAGTLSIGSLETLSASCLPPLLAAFRRTHPEVTLQLEVAGSGVLLQRLRRGEVDVCFVFGEPANDEALCSEPVAEEPLVVIAPRQHRLASMEEANALSLAAEPWLVTRPGCVYRRMFDQAFRDAGMAQPTIIGEFDSIGTIRALVENGSGCALLPRLAIADAVDRLVVQPWKGSAETVSIHMLWRRRPLLPPALQLFLEDARHGFRMLSNEPMTAVDVQHAAGGEAVTHQEADRLGNILRLADPSYR